MARAAPLDVRGGLYRVSDRPLLRSLNRGSVSRRREPTMGKLLLWTGLAVLVVGLGWLFLLPVSPYCPYAGGAGIVASPCDEAQAAQENKDALQWVAAAGGAMAGLGGLIQAVKKR